MLSTARDEIQPEDFFVVQKLIYEYAGITLSDAKQVMVHSRLAKRLRALKYRNYGEYLDFLQSPKGLDERVEFINCLTTNKTDFFRENHHFEFLQRVVFPNLGRHGRLRIWSAACSSGEEPYSIAMCIREFFAEHADTLILATDIDTAVLAKAAEGTYRSDQVNGVSEARLNRFFEQLSNKHEVSYRVKKTLRDIVKFGRLNFSDRQWPISSRFDIIFCRNAMIYFNAETQQRLVERFATLIKPGGYLIIGHSESLHGVTDIFEPLGKTVYRLKSATGKPQPATLVKPKVPATLAPSIAAPTPSIPGRIAVGPARHPEPADKFSIIVGQSHVSRQPRWVTTVLGSCIAACLFDECAGVGGVNHFMLPSSEYGDRVCGSYGVHAMEILINELMKQGAHRSRLKAKLFGGATVVEPFRHLDNVGQRNIEFAHSFLANESIPLVAERIGGHDALYLRFHTTTFEAQVKLLNPQTTHKVGEAENTRAVHIKPAYGAITLL